MTKLILRGICETGIQPEIELAVVARLLGLAQLVIRRSRKQMIVIVVFVRAGRVRVDGARGHRWHGSGAGEGRRRSARRRL